MTAAPPRDHVACLYDDTFQLYPIVSRYLREGIERGESVCIIATELTRMVLESALRGVGISVPEGERRGQISVHDAEETLGAFMVDGIHGRRPEPEAFTRVAGGLVDRASDEGRYPEVRIYGEMASLLWEQGNKAATVDLEGLWNDLRDTRRFHLLCSHRRESFAACDAESFDELCGLHSAVQRSLP